MREGGNAGANRKPGSVEDNHSSGTAVTNCLKQPTRESARDRRWSKHCNTPIGALRFARTPLFGLAPGGVYRAANCYQSRGALLPHLFTLTGRGRRYIFCGTFHGLTPPRRYLAPCPKEPGLSSVTQRVAAIAWPTPAFPGEDSTGKSRRRSCACAATAYERAPARDQWLWARQQTGDCSHSWLATLRFTSLEQTPCSLPFSNIDISPPTATGRSASAAPTACLWSVQACGHRSRFSCGRLLWRRWRLPVCREERRQAR